MAASIQTLRFFRSHFPARCLGKGSWLYTSNSHQRLKHHQKNKTKVFDDKNDNNEERHLSYCEMLKQRQAEAEKSVIVEFTKGTSVRDMYFSVKSIGGRIKEAFFYKVKNMGYVLFEFEDPEAAQHFHTNRIDLWRLLCFHHKESNRYHSKLPPFVSKDELMGVDFDIRLLDTAESLSDQIKTLHYYRRMRQQQKRCQFFVCHQVQETVRKLFPEAVVLPFGSGVTGFGLATGSDLDMVMLVDRPPEEKFINSSLSYALIEHDPRYDLSTNHLRKAGSLLRLSAGIIQVESILRARVPIIKFRHSFTGLECDLSANQSAGVRISQILYTMSQYDERFHPLVTVIKTWGRASGVTQSTPFEGFSSFMLNMLVMHFLQTREHPVLPAIKDMYRPDVDEEQVELLSTRTDKSFLKSISQLHMSQNTQSLGDLLMEFFQYFAHFDFSKYTIDLHNGVRIEDKGLHCIRIINPCDTEHNICRNVKRKYLERFQKQCLFAVESLEKKVNQQDTSPWGLSYVINPALMTSQTKGLSDRLRMADSLGTSNYVNIENLYEEEGVSVETHNFESETKVPR